MGLSSLAIAMATTVALMGGLYLLSNLVLYRGLVPLTTSIPIRGFSKPLFYLLIMPGTVIHELSHWAACVLTRVRVLKYTYSVPSQTASSGRLSTSAATRSGAISSPLPRLSVAVWPFSS